MPRRRSPSLVIAVVVATCATASMLAQAPSLERVTIKVDAAKAIGPMKPIWAWFGYDEPNYTYMKDGQKLLDRARGAEPGARVRPHAQPAHHRRRHAGAEVGIDQRLHRGRGRQADLRLDDRRSHRRHVPRARDEAAVADRLHAGGAVGASRSRTGTLDSRATNYNDIYTGWAYPPKDYAKWGELVYQWAHALGRRGTGARKSRAGSGKSGTSPTSATGRARPKSIMKLYDYAADGLKRALPTARIGGPEVTGPERRAHAADPARLPRALPARHELRDRQDRLAARLRRRSTRRARRACAGRRRTCA